MPAPTNFVDLIRQARSGDEAAWEALVHHFKPFIQRVARIRMRQHGDYDRLRHDVGSSDVCQSVFKSLFRGLRKDRYQLDQSSDMERLLRVMIRFNVATKARRSSVRLRELIDDFMHGEWMDSGPRPDQEIAERDLIEAIEEQFSEEELELVTLWLDDTPWAAIGEKLGCSGDAARVRLNRALARVQKTMKLGDHAGD